ncbi:penicillin-binding protein 1A [Methylovirgula sp. HY1]|uniref:penicillin-binding protein 1A n=1 Tax=Methylovirgula sp. HY1 TaxID=2822761 RepID=UPI001C5A79CC|nr:penicillin-binding protein 1A [Methylovirgula sp. HY1]QXX73716.1 Penicillin-binding protein 1A [Methylovirgula sp. HY1]
MRLIARFLGFVFASAAMLFVVGIGVAAVVVWKFEQDLPDYTQLKNYEPPVMTRVHAADGSVLAEYSHQRRLYLPASAIPPLLKEAFISAEDKNFYTHHGLDPEGILRALIVLVEGGRHVQGASTITQQVAKNFFLTNKRTIQRKIREALLSLRIEGAYSKQKILELYLNEIYLGLGNYGVAAAALNYFDKSVYELTVAEVAYLAALPKAPNNYNPFTKRERAIDRRNWVIDRMVENGYVSREAGDKAKTEPLGVTPRVLSPSTYAAGYFAEDVRRELLDRYGEKKLYEGGLSVRTTLDPKMQIMARRALVDGLVRYDEAHGFRGPLKHIDISQDWGLALAKVPALDDVAPWRLAVVLDSSDKQVRVGLQPTHEPSGAVGPERVTGYLATVGLKWITRRGKRNSLEAGDVVYVEPLEDQPGQYRLRQIPQVSGAIVVQDPFTGRVLAMVGGFSYDQSEFNRATQAWRQPGSSFKPFVYAAAIDNGYTPSTTVLDEPVAIDQGPGLGVWRPENFEHKSTGPHTLRYGLEHSINQMTVRLARDIGMPLIAEYAKKFGIYDDLPLYLSMSIGSGETTLMRMTTAYSMLDNGGKRITATLIDRIQDRWGQTIYRHDKRICEGCNAVKWDNQPEPTIIDKREQVIDPLTAYQLTSMMEGVIQYGTGQAIRAVGKHLAGKTGTTNDAKDLWFMGYSPNLTVGVFMGYDRPRSLGRAAQAALYTAPMFRDFMKMALKDKPDTPFRVPPGIKLISVDPKTGLRATGAGTILEAFKPGTQPPDSVYAGVGDQMPRVLSVSPDADRAAGTGTGGLY